MTTTSLPTSKTNSPETEDAQSLMDRYKFSTEKGEVFNEEACEIIRGAILPNIRLSVEQKKWVHMLINDGLKKNSSSGNTKIDLALFNPLVLYINSCKQ